MSFVLPVSVYENEDYNDLRRGYILLIASLIEGFLIEGDSNDHADMIIAIEKSCYDNSIEIAEYELMTPSFANAVFVQLYRTRITRITKNLDINSEVGDDHLAMGLLDGAVDPTRVSWLDNKALSPMNNMAYLEELNTRLNQTVTLKTSSLYRCRKCGARQATIRSAQLRSCDEGESLLLACVPCGYRWVL